jgi:hypothetical protein
MPEQPVEFALGQRQLDAPAAEGGGGVNSRKSRRLSCAKRDPKFCAGKAGSLPSA